MYMDLERLLLLYRAGLAACGARGQHSFITCHWQCQTKRLVLAPRQLAAHRDRRTSPREAVGQRTTPYRTPRDRHARARAAVGTHPPMARRLNTLRLPAVIPEGSAYESSSDKENEPVPPTRAEVAAADAALKRMEAALRVSQAVKKPTKSERVARDVARAMAAHARRPSAEDDAPRWSDDDAAGRALNEVDDNWRDDPVLNQGRARRRTLGGTQRRRPRRIVPPVPIVSPPPSTERLLRARDRMVQARKRLHQCSPGRSLCEDLGCGCASNEAAPMVGLCAADATECAIQ